MKHWRRWKKSAACLPEDYLIEKIKAAIVIAVKKDYEVEDDNVVVDIDPEIGAFRASLLRDIVEEVENPHTQVSLEDAQKVRKSYKVGQRMVTPLKTKEFGRIAAQTAKHVIRQGLREGERNLQCSEMQSRAHELITATVVSIDPERGNIVLDLGKGGSAVLPRNEQVPRGDLPRGRDRAGLRRRCAGDRPRPPCDHQPHPSGPGQADV